MQLTQVTGSGSTLSIVTLAVLPLGHTGGLECRSYRHILARWRGRGYLAGTYDSFVWESDGCWTAEDNHSVKIWLCKVSEGGTGMIRYMIHGYIVACLEVRQRYVDMIVVRLWPELTNVREALLCHDR